MFANNADVWAPGDSFGIRTQTGIEKIPHTQYQVNPQNVAIGIAGLLVLAFLAHRATRGRGRRR